MSIINLGLKTDWRTAIIQDTIDTFFGSVAPVTIGYPQWVQTVLQPAQIKAMKATPVQVAPAPGPGRIIILHEAFMQYKFVTTPYGNTGNNDVEIYWQAAGSANAYTTWNSGGLLNQSANAVEDGLMATVAVAQSLAENQPLVVAHTGGVSEFITGDGLLVINLMYIIGGLL